MARREPAPPAELTPDLGPALPRNWYCLGPSQHVRTGQVATHTVGDRAIVLWRDAAGGRLTAFAAQCAHMGCHLGSACVRGAHLECALHRRRIDASGQFLRGPDATYAGLVQAAFPVQEYLGAIFVHTSATVEPLAPLDPAEYTTRYAGEIRFPLPWQPVVANGFDVDHLASVHDRELLESPTITQRSVTEFQLQYRTRPVIRTLGDRVMSWLATDGIRGSIKAFAGTMMLVESDVGQRRTFILMSFVPDGSGGTIIRSTVGVRGRGPVQGHLAAMVARALFRAFLRKDIGVLAALRWHEPRQAHTIGDRFTHQFCEYLRGLPHA
jgi:aminopyrrolnitrin oxygenase